MSRIDRRKRVGVSLGVLGAAAAGLAPTGAASAQSRAVSVPVPGIVSSTVSTSIAGVPGVSVTLPVPSSTTSSAPAPSSTTTSTTSDGTTSVMPSSTSSTSSEAGAPTAAPAVARQRAQRKSGHHRRAKVVHGKAVTAAPRGHRRAPTPGLRTAAGLPSAQNPTLSIFNLGAAPIGVPDFFIDNFRIPPFLLPIYQAAGTQYDVPWQVLAAINEIETDYGRNVSTSTAGAEGWMQFLPSTWKQWGVDATGTGAKDPFNPADAIFGAARYLHAAGASHDLRGAIFAYNHADWYVNSVLLRARLIGGLPPDLLGALTGLTEGYFPVHARATYADDVSERALLAHTRPGARPDAAQAGRTGVNIFAKAGSPVIAVQDGVILGRGHSPTLGDFVRMRDAYGNTYTYARLKTIVSRYPVPKPQTESPTQISHALRRPAPRDAAPKAPATAGIQLPAPAPAPAPVPVRAAPALSVAEVRAAQAATAELTRGASGVLAAIRQVAGAGGPPAPQIPGAGTLALTPPTAATSTLPGVTTLDAYFAHVYGLHRNDVVLRPLNVGSKVIAGTILGRIGVTSPAVAPHVLFQIRPAGVGAPLIDPKPILDGWVLLARSSIYRAKGVNPFLKGGPTIGQVLLESKEQLTRQVLRDPRLSIYSCGRRDIATGQIDLRVLASLEFLSVSGLRPTVSGLKCGVRTSQRTSFLSGNASGNAADISAVNGMPIAGHQGPETITDFTIRRLLTLQGTDKPFQIISRMTFPSTDNTFSERGYADRIHIAFLPLYNTDRRIRAKIDSVLKPSQWIKLIGRLGSISEPQVPAAPSGAAIPDTKTP